MGDGNDADSVRRLGVILLGLLGGGGGGRRKIRVRDEVWGLVTMEAIGLGARGGGGGGNEGRKGDMDEDGG